MNGLISYEKPPETKVSLFSNAIYKSPIFKNNNILNNWHKPIQILHRDEEIKQISRILAPIIRGYKPSNIFIYGTTGTGKTITTKFIINELKKTLNEIKKNTKIIYVNCKMKKVADTEYRLLAQLLKEFDYNVPETGIPTSSLYKRFFDLVSNTQTILVLDEIDVLFNKIGDEFLYNFTRSELPISIIGITNSLLFHNGLDARVKSSLGEEEIIFKPYNAEQLKDILKTRLGAFNNDTVDEAVINKCAALAAQEHGDARKALELLRVSAEIAERNCDEKVTELHVDLAEYKINNDRISEALKAQPKQSQAVLAAMLELDARKNERWSDRRISSTELYSTYTKVCESAGLKILTQRRINVLINELEMLGIFLTKIKSKGRYGKLREVSLVDNEQIRIKIKRIISENGF